MSGALALCCQFIGTVLLTIGLVLLVHWHCAAGSLALCL